MSESLRFKIKNLSGSLKPSPDRIIVDYAGLPPVTGFPSPDNHLSDLKDLPTPTIRTGLQSLDYECALGGHLIVLIGETASGKTAILNTIEKTAHRNKQECVRVKEGLNFDEMHVRIANIIGRRAPIKLIEWSGSFHDNMGWISHLRSGLVSNDEWAVISIPANRASHTMDVIDRAPSEMIRMADYVFSIQKGKEFPYEGKSRIINIKNRYRHRNRRTACFSIRFKQSAVTNHPTMLQVIAEEINWPLTK